MTLHHKVKDVHIENDILRLIIDGNSIQVELKDISRLLATAKEDEKQEFEISPSGYGIHWPLIDEDISIDGLLGVIHKPSANIKSA